MAMITTTTIKSIQKNNLNLKFCLRSIRNAQFRVCHVYSFFSKRCPMNIYNVTIYNKITKFQANHQSTATTHSQKKKKLRLRQHSWRTIRHKNFFILTSRLPQLQPHKLKLPHSPGQKKKKNHPYKTKSKLSNFVTCQTLLPLNALIRYQAQRVIESHKVHYKIAPHYTTEHTTFL